LDTPIGDFIMLQVDEMIREGLVAAESGERCTANFNSHIWIEGPEADRGDVVCGRCGITPPEFDRTYGERGSASLYGIAMALVGLTFAFTLLHPFLTAVTQLTTLLGG
jgi:hypothetical protein